MTMTLPDRRRLLAALAVLPLLPRAAQARALRRPWPAGRATPPLALPGYEGPGFDLAAAKGRVVLLNFWAGWCEPCRDEMPSLELLAQRHAGDGLQVVAVNHRETDAAIRRFMDFMPLTLTRVVRDADGAAARDWGVRVFPTTVAVGREGRAAFSVVGEIDWSGPEAADGLAPLLRRA
jgi:thiol-disulfide isomerase/thioredoxin